jgi:hypothetical protein
MSKVKQKTNCSPLKKGENIANIASVSSGKYSQTADLSGENLACCIFCGGLIRVKEFCSCRCDYLNPQFIKGEFHTMTCPPPADCIYPYGELSPSVARCGAPDEGLCDQSGNTTKKDVYKDRARQAVKNYFKHKKPVRNKNKSRIFRQKGQAQDK